MLAALAQSPDAANTIIVFFGDHGLHQGEHNWLNKVTLFDRGARVPLLIVPPGPPKLGTVCRQPVELLGLYPTLLDLAGLAHPPGLQGLSLRPLLRDPAERSTRPAYSVVSRAGKTLGRSIHTDRFNSTEWGEGRAGIELYDHFLDPYEYHNRHASPEYSAVQADLKRQLAAAKPPTL